MSDRTTHLILLRCFTCNEDAEAADTRLHEDEVECGTCRSKRYRRAALADIDTCTEEDRRAEARITAHQKRCAAMQPGGLARAQAGS